MARMVSIPMTRKSVLGSTLGFLYRHSPVVTHMKELIDQGFIGDVQLVQNVGAMRSLPIPPRHCTGKCRSGTRTVGSLSNMARIPSTLRAGWAVHSGLWWHTA
jgi:hypothetical protein